MTYQEFVEKTGVQVSLDEYWEMNELYNHCMMTKDEFCDWWCKSNEDRVAEAEAKRQEQEAKRKKQEIALDILLRLDKKVTVYNNWHPADEFLGKRMKENLKKIGIRLYDGTMIMTVQHQLNQIVRGM